MDSSPFARHLALFRSLPHLTRETQTHTPKDPKMSKGGSPSVPLCLNLMKNPTLRDVTLDLPGVSL